MTNHSSKNRHIGYALKMQLLVLIAGLTVALMPVPLHADDTPAYEPSSENAMSLETGLLGDRALGDFNGGLTWLEDRGITLEAAYMADYFVNTRGGLNTSGTHTYRGLLDVGLTIETEPLGLWEGGTLFILGQEIHGRDISVRHVGDLQALNNNDAPARTQVAEYWYQQDLFGEVLSIRLGKMDANAEFAYAEYGSEFINSSAGIAPNIPMPQYPDPTLGVEVFFRYSELFSVAAAVHDAQGIGTSWGFDTAFHDRNDSFSVVELSLTPEWQLADQSLQGRYCAGGWYHSGTWETFPHEPDRWRGPRSHRGNAGVYANLDQQIFIESSDTTEGTQGLDMFFMFSWAPSDYNEISQYYGAGCQYVGLIPTRDQDITGLGMFHVSLAGKIQSVEQRYSETAIELFHRFEITPSFAIKPDVQYIVNPGGAGPDAIAAGVRIELYF